MAKRKLEKKSTPQAETPATPPAAEPPPPAPMTAPVLAGDYRLPQMHAMFPPQINFLLRFFVKRKGTKLPKCPCCGKETQNRSCWTMVCPFMGTREAAFTFVKVGPFLPLTLICSDHPMSPVDQIEEALDASSWEFIARQVRGWDAFKAEASPAKAKRDQAAAGGGA